MNTRSLMTCAVALGVAAACSMTIADITLAEPSPGTAGQMNTWTASGAEPGAFVGFIFGLQSGSLELPNCPGVSIGIARPAVFGVSRANQDGDATVRRFVPRPVGGVTVLFQAAAPLSCEVSNVVEFTFGE